jgi:hypothetical protein
MLFVKKTVYPDFTIQAYGCHNTLLNYNKMKLSFWELILPLCGKLSGITAKCRNTSCLRTGKKVGVTSIRTSDQSKDNIHNSNFPHPKGVMHLENSIF